MIPKTMIGSRMPMQTQAFGLFVQSLKRQKTAPRITKQMIAKVPLPMPKTSPS